MTAFSKINRIMLYVAVSLLALAVIAFTCIGVSQARFNKTYISSFVYGTAKSDNGTMSKDKRIFDFGIWKIGDGDSLNSVVVIEGASGLKGTVNFKLDDATAKAKDIAIQIDGAYTSGNGQYTVNEADGLLELPFSLFLSPTNRSATVYLDVEWIPDGSTKATLSARYLVSINPFSQAETGSVDFDQEKTEFLTNDLLNFSINVSKTAKGVMLASGSVITNKFSSGVVYYTDTYPQGVTLLKSSTIYLTNVKDGKVNGVINLGKFTDDKPINITAGVSETKYVVISQTPLSAKNTITATTDNQPIVSHTKPLTVKIKETAELHDDNWNNSGSGANQLSWKVERLVDGEYVSVETSKNLTITKKQSGNSGELVISAPTGDQPAGTYRLKLIQKHNGYIVGTTDFWFFIDYR